MSSHLVLFISPQNERLYLLLDGIRDVSVYVNMKFLSSFCSSWNIIGKQIRRVERIEMIAWVISVLKIQENISNSECKDSILCEVLFGV